MDKTHVLILGRIPALSRLEIEASLRRRGSTISSLTVAGDLGVVKADPEPDESWFLTLGGAVKFGRVESRVPLDDPDALLGALVALTQGFRDVGLSILDPQLVGRDLGQALKKQSSTVRRYVLPSEGVQLSAAQSKALTREDGIELLLFVEHDQVCLVHITAVQDIDAFTHRDRDVPVADPIRGMLPTKLARILTNIGLGRTSSAQPVLLDPFVGTGRVLMEGMLLGAQVYGADIDPTAVEATRTNLTWLSKECKTSVPYNDEQIFVAPIEKLATLLSAGSIDTIVTEPFLGPPQRTQPTSAQSESLIRELKPLYASLFRAGNQLLKPSGSLVAVLPVIGDRPLGAEFVDRWSHFGYHVLDSVRVSRPDQFIGREVYILQKVG